MRAATAASSRSAAFARGGSDRWPGVSHARPQRWPRGSRASASSVVSLRSVEQLAVGHGARRDDARHLALHRPLGRGDVAHLLGDRHRLAELDQPREVGFQRVHRHAGHHHRLAGAAAARGQRDVEQPVGAPRHRRRTARRSRPSGTAPGVRMLGLDAKVLLHHRRVGGKIRVDTNPVCCPRVVHNSLNTNKNMTSTCPATTPVITRLMVSTLSIPE